MINDLWYKNAVIYCLSVGTFMDANADGIGDFQGLMRRLDYLHGLAAFSATVKVIALRLVEMKTRFSLRRQRTGTLR